MSSSSPNYIFEAREKPSLDQFAVPLIEATQESVKGYGYLIDDPDDCEIEIVTWPAQGWRPIDQGTGNEGGYVEGIFSAKWYGDVLMGSNQAVNGDYVLGWSTDPQSASSELVPVALPGDDLTPDKVIAFWCGGNKGLYIHPGIWHEGIFPAVGHQSFLDRQGRVHARVSCDIGEEFGVYLAVPLYR